MKLSDEDFAKVAADNGGEENVKRVETALGTVVLRTPTRGEYKRFRAHFLDEKKRADSTEILARATVVYPDKMAFDAMIDRKPGIADVVGKAAVDLASGEAQEDAGK